MNWMWICFKQSSFHSRNAAMIVNGSCRRIFGTWKRCTPLAFEDTHALGLLCAKPGVPAKVSLQTLVDFLKVLRRRIPSRYLPKHGSNIGYLKHGCQIKNTIYIYHECGLRQNLKTLVGIDETDTKHCSRRFWRWLNKQPWRGMLPTPKEILDWLLNLRGSTACPY